LILALAMPPALGGVAAAAGASPWSTGGNGAAVGDFLGTTNAQPLVLKTDNQERARISQDGRVGIGPTAFEPRTALHVRGGIASGEDHQSAGAVSLYPPDGFAWFHIDNGGAQRPTGRLRISAGVAPGQEEFVSILQNGNVGVGTSSPDAKLHVAGTTRTGVLEITGGSDLAEPFEVAGAGVAQPGMLVAIDPTDPTQPGRLRVAGSAYDRTVAGVVSGANGIKAGVVMKQDATVADGSLPVALSGRVYAWADASNGPIEPGDLLTTSTKPGHAMKVTDPARAQGATIGKAMSSLREGTGLVLVLVSLQ
jgi:hypothetical protein